MGGKTEFSISVESLRTDYWLHVSTMFKILALQLLIRAAIATAKPFSGLQKLGKKFQKLGITSSLTHHQFRNNMDHNISSKEYCT